MKFFNLVVFILCVILLDVSLAYKAAILHNNDISAKEFASFVYEVGKEEVDILVLPSPEWKDSVDNFETRVRKLSKAASQAGLYLVATLLDSASCRNERDIVKTNIVFNRNGDIVADYRKPVSKSANCTSPPKELVTITTDFGVKFGILMDEDILLHDEEYTRGVKNFVMTDANSEGNALSGAQLSASWSYVNGANLISSTGIHSAKSGLKTGSGKLEVAEIDTNGATENAAVPVIKPNSFPSGDFSQYAVKPLDLVASAQGYKETVCHQSFCCEYFVKTVDKGLKTEVSYNLAAFDGVLPLTPHQYIGVQNCAVVSIEEPSEQRLTNGNILFERISIAANFSKHNVQYPIIESTSVLPTEKFSFETNTNDILKQVTLELSNVNVAGVGIFGRDFSKDFDVAKNNNSENTHDIYDLIFNEDVQEFFDYVWIRLRILIVVVSIYVLEML